MIKQVICIRKDLKMRRGKECAQSAHASLGAFMNFKGDAAILHQWRYSGQTKICLQVESEQELLDLCEQAKNAKLNHYLVTDAGKTEFGGVPTITTLAIGPAEESDIDAITGHLKLY